MSDMKQEEAVIRVKRANADGFMTHLVVAGEKTAEQAQTLYKRSDAKATKLIEKRAMIHAHVREELIAKGKIAVPAVS